MSHQTSNLCSPGALRVIMMLLGMSLPVYILGPPLYWQLAEGLASVRHAAACPPSICDCTVESLATISPALGNTSFVEFGNHDPNVNEGMENNYADLLVEELKLQDIVILKKLERGHKQQLARSLYNSFQILDR